MWWWRKVRRAHISKDDRDRFERYGENVVALLLASELAEHPETGTGFFIKSGSFSRIYETVIVNVNAAAAWLTERADLHERREDRLEHLELAVLIFVGIGVAVYIAVFIPP